MKKAFVLGLLTILAITGCQAELEAPNDELVALTQDSSKVFTAIVDDDLCGDTKTSMDGSGKVRWKLGDQVSIFAGNTVNEQYQVSDSSDGKTTASFNKVSGSGFVSGTSTDNNVAFYPYASTAELVKSGSNYVIRGIELPSTQTYAEGSFGNGSFPMAAVTSTKEDMNLKFKNVLGGLKLQLKGTATITSISVTGNNDEILCGNADVIVSTGSTPTISLSNASAKSVTLDCGAGVTLDSETATPFIIALPPMTMSGGFTVVVTDSEGKQMEIKTTKSQTITRSNLLKMPAVTYEGTDVMQPLTFTSTGSTSISLTKEGEPDAITLEYKVGDGVWSSYTIGDTIDLTDGQEVSFRAGASCNSSFSRDYHSNFYRFTINGSGTIAASGDIMSLLNNEGGLTIPAAYCFCNLFQNCSKLTSAPELPATTLVRGCYMNMFNGCTSLTSAPELPATALASDCYAYMFGGCTSLTAAPELPATTLSSGCYFSMFSYCRGFTNTPELPATTLANHCYLGMFMGCTGLTKAPKELPATTLTSGCYFSMFEGCTNMTTAPKELPATTLANECYKCMFDGCIGLTSAPELPATTLANECYKCMFRGCTGLTSAPELPATTLANECYSTMFSGCTGLTSAVELPATTLANGCYTFMFWGCTGMTTAPELPATTLADWCYYRMFYGCTGMTTAPELPATSLASGCYFEMFSGCTKLDYIKALFTTTPSSSYTNNWVYGVSANGTFVKSMDATWDVTGANGVPKGWTVIKDGQNNDNPLTFTATGSTSISLIKEGEPDAITLEYKVNDGEWASYTVGNAIDLTDGQEVCFRAGEGGNASFSLSDRDYYSFTVTGNGTVAASGTIMSLIDIEGCSTIPSAFCFFRLFYVCDKLTSAPELPATTLSYGCYSEMFNGCTGLTTAPELPATTLADWCYSGMFYGCTGLATAPELPATTLAKYCYGAMFSGCTGLTTAPELPATTLADWCYSGMFNGCTGLTTAPELPATTLANECYSTMFANCTNLATVPKLPATTLAENCYESMFYRCTSLTSAPELPATTLASSCYIGMFSRCAGLTVAPKLPATILAEKCYDSMFYRCTSLTTAPELPATTLAKYCYSEMFMDCTGLTSAPDLPATTLTDYCYGHMFYGCTKLNYIKALFTTTPSSSYTNNWVTGVSATGTFVKSKDATWDVRGVNGVPKGWTVYSAVAPAEVAAVDLGLSVKWATCNVGATRPEEYGEHFAWGETEQKSNYSWSTYKWCNGDYNKLTKYCPSGKTGYWAGSGSPDNKTVLDPEDDAARANWGGSWRMPTDEEWSELRTKCNWMWTSNYNGTGIAGRVVTASNGNSIFLPAAGWRGDTYLCCVGSDGAYWPSSLDTDDPYGAWNVDFYSGDVYRRGSSRYSGQSVRPVCPKE